MTDKIEPALTAEEWAEREATRPILPSDNEADVEEGAERAFVAIRADGGFAAGSWHIRDDIGSVLSVPPGSPLITAAIALANAALPDSDPRKITWRRLVQLREAWASAWAADENPFLDALTSYLPPDPTS